MSFGFVRHMRDQFKVNVLAVEYPGYGLLNALEPSEERVNRVMLTVFRFLVDEMHVKYDRIYLFGRSIGTGPAVKLASQYPVGGLILVSAFMSIKAAIETIAGPFVSMAFNERFPNAALIQNVQCPTLFIHGEKDALIPAEHSLQLFQKCRARKLLITPARMEHNSNLWGDSQYLAVPAINFFGLPGFSTERPPKMHPCLFDADKRGRAFGCASDEKGSPWFWFCGFQGQVRRAATAPIESAVGGDELAGGPTCPPSARQAERKAQAEAKAEADTRMAQGGSKLEDWAEQSTGDNMSEKNESSDASSSGKKIRELLAPEQEAGQVVGC